MKKFSVACRVVSNERGERIRGCGAGWWLDDIEPRTPTNFGCPRCGQTIVVTGSVTVIDL